MKFQKGMSRPPNAGRKKGSKNKKKIAKVADYLSERDINPVEEILNLLPDMKPADQAAMWLDLLSYCEVKPKENEADSDDDDEILDDLSDEQLLKLVEAT